MPTIQLSPATIAFLRGLGMSLIIATLTFAASATNIDPVFGTAAGGIIATFALMFEHVLSPNGTALAGSVRIKQ